MLTQTTDRAIRELKRTLKEGNIPRDIPCGVCILSASCVKRRKYNLEGCPFGVKK